jgi:hypothetical protein
MYSHLSGNSAFHKYEEFCLDVDVVEAPWLLANQLGQIIGQVFAVAEKHCSKTQKPPWSAKLHIALLVDSAYSQAHSGPTEHGAEKSRHGDMAGHAATDNTCQHPDPQ